MSVKQLCMSKCHMMIVNLSMNCSLSNANDSSDSDIPLDGLMEADNASEFTFGRSNNTSQRQSHIHSPLSRDDETNIIDLTRDDNEQTLTNTDMFHEQHNDTDIVKIEEEDSEEEEEEEKEEGEEEGEEGRGERRG